jgi:hypothetical protein
MKSLLCATALCLSFALSAAADAAQIDAKSLAGDWYGEGQPGDPNIYWIDHFGSDGSFAMESRSCGRGSGSYNVEAGSWRYGGGRLRIVTEFVNGHPVHYVDEYEITSLDGHKKSDRLVASDGNPGVIGYIFSSVRPEKGFKLPTCGSTA